MSGQTVILSTPEARRRAHWIVEQAKDGAVVNVSEAKEERTKAQNRLVHRWFSDVERASVGLSAAEVKAHCNLEYGRPILARDDPEWEAAFGYIFDALNYEAKRKAVRVLDVPFTRRMSVKQLTEYMDQMRRDYAEIGIYLTDPEAQKYEGAA